MMSGVIGLAGCGDDANLEDYSAPLRVIERTEFFLTGLKDQKLPSPGFDPPNDLALSYSGELIRVELPSALAGGVKDESRKQQVIAKCEQLKQLFAEQVDAPAQADPPQIDKAIAGVEKCLALVSEIKAVLGG
jgi:hypothetical protein